MKNLIQNFFYPKKICIVGASSKEKSIGFEILNSIKKYSYTGSIIPVNPKADKILGYNCKKSILEVNENIDLAIIVVPKKFAEESIDQLIEKNVKNIILITAGFRETGEEGKQEERKILGKINRNKIRMVGPNCMGVINTLDTVRLNATFVAEQPERGGIGFLSQSGALGAAVLNSLKQTDIKFAHFISIGNKADVSEIDILEFWLNDNNIKSIAMYLESFDNGLNFIKNYKSRETDKPLIVLKAGKTKAGMKAASSHTGALSSNERIIDSLLKQFGIIRVNNINEMFNTAKGFEYFPMPKGKNIAIVTNAGGPAILAVDTLDENQLTLSEFSAETKKELAKIVHPEGSINNPVDLLPGGTPEVYKKVNEIILNDDSVDAVISIFVEPVMVNAFDVIEAVNTIDSPKPIYQVCMPLPDFWQKYSKTSKYKKPIYSNPEDPANVISNLLLFNKKRNMTIEFPGVEHSEWIDTNSAKFIDQNEISRICKHYKLPVIDNKTISSNEFKSLPELEYPLVAKGLNESVIHKSELNAVILNIKNEDELNKAVSELEENFKKNGYNLDGIILQPFIKTKHELLVGGYRDPSFGPVVMFGSGGKYVEILDDIQIRSVFLTDDDLDSIISETKIGKIIKGVRGEKEADIIQLKNIIRNVAKLLVEEKSILEIDLNPLIIDEQNNYHAVDVRIKSA